MPPSSVFHQVTAQRIINETEDARTDREVMTTVKRVPGGQVSNRMIDRLQEGDELAATRPSDTFCLDDAGAPLLGFTDGSDITPILSLVKSALATTDREVRLLCADLSADTVMFASALNDLSTRYPERLSVQRHFDSERGLLNARPSRSSSVQMS
jgi:ferredoxin-NADP reductase